MTINTHPEDRREMVRAISEQLQTPAIYMRSPTYAFQIGSVTVNRDGSVSCEDEALLESLRPMLIERGWLDDENAQPETEQEAEQDETDEAENLEAAEAEGEAAIEAQEEALDTALSNAGFGIQFADVGSESEEYGSEVPVGAKVEIAKPVQVKTADAKPVQTKVEVAEPVQKQPETVKTAPQEPVKADPLDAIMADDMPVPEQVTAEVVEKPKTVVRESVQPAQTPAEQPQNVIVLEQEPPAAAYTQSSPVEEIRRQMTYEQAQNVIVDCGTCKGWTLAQVADRRAASLRWYVKGYQGENNILRAAAAIIWDSLQEKQAG